MPTHMSIGPKTASAAETEFTCWPSRQSCYGARVEVEDLEVTAYDHIGTQPLEGSQEELFRAPR